MCDIDSPRFQAMDDIGYCFDQERQHKNGKIKYWKMLNQMKPQKYNLITLKIH